MTKIVRILVAPTCVSVMLSAVVPAVSYTHLSFLLGRIVVVDTIDHGMKVSAKYRRSLRIVTLEGELLNLGGSMTGLSLIHI